MIQTSHTTSSFFVKSLMNCKKTLGNNDSTLFPRVFCDDQMLIFLFAIRFFWECPKVCVNLQTDVR